MTQALAVTAGTRACAIPLQFVLETMRPLAVAAVSGAPSFVQGLSIIRGEPLPVIDIAALLGESEGAVVGRFVTVQTGDRRVAFALTSVTGIIELDADSLVTLPSLLHSAETALIEAIAQRDTSLLMVLRATHLVSNEVWATITASAAAE